MPKLAHILAGAAMLTFPAAAIAQEAQPAPTTTTNTPAGASAAATAAAPAAQLGADGKVVLAEGTPVVDTQGAAVGTLTKVETDAAGQPTNVVLKTTKSEVLIPASSLARTEKNALIAMTAAQIDAAAAAAGPSPAPAATQTPETGAATGAETDASAEAAGSASASPSN